MEHQDTARVIFDPCVSFLPIFLLLFLFNFSHGAACPGIFLLSVCSIIRKKKKKGLTQPKDLLQFISTRAWTDTGMYLLLHGSARLCLARLMPPLDAIAHDTLHTKVEADHS